MKAEPPIKQSSIKHDQGGEQYCMKCNQRGVQIEQLMTPSSCGGRMLESTKDNLAHRALAACSTSQAAGRNIELARPVKRRRIMVQLAMRIAASPQTHLRTHLNLGVVDCRAIAAFNALAYTEVFIVQKLLAQPPVFRMILHQALKTLVQFGTAFTPPAELVHQLTNAFDNQFPARLFLICGAIANNSAQCHTSLNSHGWGP